MMGVHPRSRGAAAGALADVQGGAGPSPLARGSLTITVYRAGPKRSIPARAGQPCCCTNASVGVRVHPRSRGAAIVEPAAWECHQGPSPLARGSPGSARCETYSSGSIPARAGQPDLFIGYPHPRWVHPRSRGAAALSDGPCPPRLGPSPLARGSPRKGAAPLHSNGSIPARAGQPSQNTCMTCSTRVHPRSRGAASVSGPPNVAVLGPSPLARGSRTARAGAAGHGGSIPARAGQP